jgi:hypothetical protein
MSKTTRRTIVKESDQRLQIRVSISNAAAIKAYADKHNYSISLAGSQIMQAGLQALGLLKTPTA